MTPEEKEILRLEVRGHLVDRAPLAQSPATIARGLRREHDVTVEQVREAAEFLVSLRHLAIRRNDVGATIYYQATAEGILAHERM